MKSENALVLGGVVMEGIAVQNTFSAAPDRVKALAAVVIGFGMIAGAIYERRRAIRREKNKSSRRHLP